MTSKKEAKKLAALRNKTRIATDTLTKEVEMADDCTKTLSRLWEEKLYKYENTAINNRLLSFQRSFTRQMEFKNKLIEKLLNELHEYKEYCSRNSQNNLELVNNTLNLFKSGIEDIHNQNKVEIKGGLPTNLPELELLRKENDDYWRMMKYNNKTIEIQSHQMNTKIKNKHRENMDLENGRFKSIMDKFHRMDVNKYNAMNNEYDLTLDDYKEKTKYMMEDYYQLKEKNGNDLRKKYKANIQKLLNKINNLNREKEESKLSIQKNMLIKDRDACQESLNNSIKKLTHDSQFFLQRLSLLCQTTKQIYHNKMKNDVEKGNNLIKIICQCEKLEKSQEKLFPRSNDLNKIQWSDKNATLEKFSHFWHRVTQVNNRSKSIDDEIEKLQYENDVLKKDIRLLINTNKN